jgi:hypothetical protein
MDILADYREWSDAQPGAIKTHSDRCHMWHRDCMIHRLADALAVEQAKRTPEPASTPGEGTRQVACTLTDEEREAIQWAVATLDAEAALGDGEFEARQAATLRGLLERLK